MNPKYHDSDSKDFEVLYDDAGYLHITKTLYPVSLLESDLDPPDSACDDNSKLILKDVCVHSGKMWEIHATSWQISQEPGSFSAARFGRISRYNQVSRDFLEIDVFIIVQFDGENRYRRISAAVSMYPAEQPQGSSFGRVDTLVYSRQHLNDAAVSMRMGGPVAYKRRRCLLHHDQEYLIEQCDNCEWASSPAQ